MSDQLAAIDEALDTGAADHSDPLTRELQELALALQADAPEPDAEFRHELGRKVQSGFRKPARCAGRSGGVRSHPLSRPGSSLCRSC